LTVGALQTLLGVHGQGEGWVAKVRSDAVTCVCLDGSQDRADISSLEVNTVLCSDGG
jgi:hypothetical protein